MHICFICHEYPPGQHGGVGSFTQTLGRSLVAHGHRATVVGMYDRKERVEEDDRGARVIRLARSPVPYSGFLRNGFQLRQALQEIHRETPIDVLEGAELSLAMIAKDFPATKIIRMNGGHHFFAVTLGQKPRRWRSWLEKRSFARADYLCAVSRFAADTTLELLGLPPRKLEILPNPVDVALFEPRPASVEDDGLILFVGTIREKKGVRQLIQAMPQIVKAVPHARLALIGRDSRDPATGESYIAQMHKLIPADLSDRIEFKGTIENSELPRSLAAAQVCVYPSHMETQGIVIVEAMAMRKAVVSTLTGPGPEVVEDEVSGLLCDPHNPVSIAEKVIRFLQDAELRRRLGEQARRDAVERFSVEALVERNLAFYRQCVNGHAAEL